MTRRTGNNVLAPGAVAVGCALALLVATPVTRVARADYNPSQLAPPESSITEDEQPLHRYHSPQNFAAQLSFGPYRPDIDSEFGRARAPYAGYFGNDRHLMSRIELEYQFFHQVGTLAIGLGTGLFRVTGSAPPANHSGQITADTSTLTVIPASLSAVYRFDYYLEHYKVPLVPHAKIGLNWAYWSITDGNGEIASSQGGRGRGGTLGWHAAIGAALVLDFIDPATAHDFDAEMGVNHTALVFEYAHYDLSGLGRSNKLHVGDTTWTLGLLFEF